MTIQFALTITTECGPITDNSFWANSAEQVATCMPNGVLNFQLAELSSHSERPMIEDEDVWLELLLMVENAKEAGMTPESDAENYKKQMRAMTGLVVDGPAKVINSILTD